MATDHDNYQSPLAGRYASKAMRHLFSANHRIGIWRRLWLALAESQQELGLAITDAQLDELRGTLDDIDHEAANRFERELRHDVMAHVHTWGEQCPEARAILHLGATSCFVTDNAELVILREALGLLKSELVGVLRALRAFALEWRSLPTLGRTHYQPAQATTVGKRATLWIQDLVDDLADLEWAESRLRFRGVKGTTGTQASFLELFEGDHDKVVALDEKVAARMGFEKRFAVTGQTYSRRLDFRVGQALAGICQSLHKLAVDVRLLAGQRELEEPIGARQIGSSAMPWKRNPMRCERICSLARHAMVELDNTAHTAANQWLERTLDDSANRRITLAQLFLATDAVLHLGLDVASGLEVRPEVVRRNLTEELPFLASEHVLMEAVRAGGDRQDLHEALRVHSRAAAEAIYQGLPNPMKERIEADPAFAQVADRLDELLDPARFVGRAPEQVLEFVAQELDPVLERFAEVESLQSEVLV